MYTDTATTSGLVGSSGGSTACPAGCATSYYPISTLPISRLPSSSSSITILFASQYADGCRLAGVVDNTCFSHSLRWVLWSHIHSPSGRFLKARGRRARWYSSCARAMALPNACESTLLIRMVFVECPFSWMALMERHLISLASTHAFSSRVRCPLVILAYRRADRDLGGSGVTYTMSRMRELVKYVWHL